MRFGPFGIQPLASGFRIRTKIMKVFFNLKQKFTQKRKRKSNKKIVILN